MFVRERDWLLIRDSFTEAEKSQLRSQVLRLVDCPRGWIVDLAALPEMLSVKHNEMLLTVKPH